MTSDQDRGQALHTLATMSTSARCLPASIPTNSVLLMPGAVITTVFDFKRYERNEICLWDFVVFNKASESRSAAFGVLIRHGYVELL